VWIDLTDLRLWKGHLSGIQRVVFSIAESYAQMDGRARFFAYDFVQQDLYEVDFDPGDFQPARQAGVPWQTRSARFLALVFMNRPRRPSVDWALTRVGARRHEPAAAFADGDGVLLLGNLWDQPGLQRAVEAAKKDRSVNVFHLIYDLIPVVAPHLSRPDLAARYAEYLFNAVVLSRELFAISRATASDLARFAAANRLELPPVTVIRLGDDVAPGESSVPNEALRERSFVLCVGTFDARKNHALLYSVWKLAQERSIELPVLVIVGGTGFGAVDSRNNLTNDPAVRDRVLVLSDVDDRGLRWLYENCRFTIYPSVYEGWGLPIAESLHHGKLCLASRSSSMTEVGGDLAEYFSPFDAAECLALVVKYLDDDLLRRREAAITSDYRSLSWSQATRYLDERLRGSSLESASSLADLVAEPDRRRDT